LRSFHPETGSGCATCDQSAETGPKEKRLELPVKRTKRRKSDDGKLFHALEAGDW